MVGEWQPIETAPREGWKPILALVDDEPTVVYWMHHWILNVGQYGEDRQCYPSHWMPLPTPPEQPSPPQSDHHPKP
jgi:hypothetical protein